MQSAPNSEQILRFLHERNYNYPNERALVEACRDSKTFFNILKDLLEPLQPSFTMAWLSAESYTFTTDVDRNRTSLPMLNDFVFVSQIAEKLGVKIRIYDFFAKKPFDKTMPILSRAIGFLQARSRVGQKISRIKVDHQKSFLAYKGTTEYLTEKEGKRKEVKNQKEREKFIIDEKADYYLQIETKNGQLKDVCRQMMKAFEQRDEELKQLQKEQAQSQMRMENLNMKISHIKRELVKLAPDIKRQKENMDLKISDVYDRINYSERVWKSISEESDSSGVVLGVYIQSFEKYLQKDKEQLIKNDKIQAEYYKLQTKVNELIPLISTNKEKNKNIIEQNSTDEGKAKKGHDYSRQVEDQMKLTSQQLEKQHVTEKSIWKGKAQGQSFRELIESQKSSVLTNLNLNYENFERTMEDLHIKMLQFWELVRTKSKQFYDNHHNPEEEEN